MKISPERFSEAELDLVGETMDKMQSYLQEHLKCDVAINWYVSKPENYMVGWNGGDEANIFLCEKIKNNIINK